MKLHGQHVGTRGRHLRGGTDHAVKSGGGKTAGGRSGGRNDAGLRGGHVLTEHLLAVDVGDEFELDLVSRHDCNAVELLAEVLRASRLHRDRLGNGNIPVGVVKSGLRPLRSDRGCRVENYHSCVL